MKSELPDPNEAAKDNKYFKILCDYGKAKLIAVYKKAKNDSIGTIIWLFLTVPGAFSAADFWKHRVLQPTTRYLASLVDSNDPEINYHRPGDGYVWVTDDDNLRIIKELKYTSDEESSSSSSEDLVFEDSIFVPSSSVPDAEGDFEDITSYLTS